MINCKLHLDPVSARNFKAAVCLHGHTLHSREPLTFVYRLARTVPLLRAALNAGERRYRHSHGQSLDLSRAFWTPPLCPREALGVEARQIEELNLSPLVSLTDHDNMDGPLSLHVVDSHCTFPVSVEWTVPFGSTFFHLGLHNINAGAARQTMALLSLYTQKPRPEELPCLLSSIASDPGTLVVFNHPLWDETGIGEDTHRALAWRFVHEYSRWLHALEINGLRPSAENRRVIDMAGVCGKPVISGGDRHALEPSAVLNLTNAATFAEFVEEIRNGFSQVLVMPHFREPFAMRMIQSIGEILSVQNGHSRGWKRWDDRVFYQCDDGVIRSLSSLWGDSPAFPVRLFVDAMQALQQQHLKNAYRIATAAREEALL